MLPIAIDPQTVRVGLAGAGEGLERRRAMLAEAGVEPVCSPYAVLFIAGLDHASSAALAAQARAAGALVNVEDLPELCDFHVPAIVRRGDLAFTVSTNGKAPALSRLLREWLERAFGFEWTARMEKVAAAREGWRGDGLAPGDVSRRTRDLVAREGWL
ncbi:MAG TPA: NAD(P)-dependent oxidoreductase [Rhizomicrobium sp.]|nr:NAD(P)-dependent oxidoreductase [Rhizomicrobium sp.]